MAHTVTAISAFSDNYIWAIGQTNNKNIVLVDPGDASVCLDYIKSQQLNLVAILITHHHSDHVGGIKELLAYSQQQNANSAQVLNVYGPANENIKYCTQPLTANNQVVVDELSLTFNILDLPGHTRGHIAYVSSTKENNASEQLLFCGDTLFSGGCGRLFEGSAEQMFNSLTKLTALPDSTKVYCAHEYTLANLTFALSIETNNIELNNYYQQIRQFSAQNIPSIPTTIALEKKINPFLRVTSSEIIINVEKLVNRKLTSDVAVFAAIRQLKDDF
jgi:hydroxyacylglutathione hydrolase